MTDCPFYGSFAFVDAGGVTRIPTGGNQCSLVTVAHAPCYLEAAGQPVDWRACERIPALVYRRLAEGDDGE